jgi:glutathione synthase/RimK-type ligase-like ATP-grasp enzyme
MYKTIIVVDRDEDAFEGDNLTVISFDHYLADYPKLNEPKTRIINLCDTEHYLSKGYYCSLLAEARQHKVLPSVSTINDLRDIPNHETDGIALKLSADLSGVKINEDVVDLQVYFGWVAEEPWKKLAKQLFDKYPSPLLHIQIVKGRNGNTIEVKRYPLSKLTQTQHQLFIERLQTFTQLVWRNRVSGKRHHWDMAILVNPEEKYPPSDKEAIKRLLKAAGKVGINAEIITPHQTSQIAQYDALFIRETTAINHHTYRLARTAEREGIVVIDDSTSILRCCNKVFLHDAFIYNKVPTLKTRVVIGSNHKDLDQVENEFDYPVVLKMPEGSFSKGVFKVDNRNELKIRLDLLLQETALVLVQEYVYTDFDWRVGVLNGRAIYACRYHMARNHWQIYNHNAKRHVSGGFETLPTFELPRKVLDAALKACAMIGHGLYGVDIKEKGSHVYVIEVNDNPSLDHKVEDVYLGDELYMLIMQEFVSRLEQRGRSSLKSN